MITTKTGLHSATHDTPVGTLTLVASDRGLRAVLWPRDQGRIRLTGRPHKNLDHQFLISAIGQLDEYFAGTRMTFDVPLDVEGTRFQLAAWRALCAIPFGTTVSYAQQAAQLGIPTAARALGAANRSNPVSIFVPCHRVIGSDGSLTGFAGGLPIKRFLIDHEVRVLALAGGNPGQGDRRALQLTAVM